MPGTSRLTAHKDWPICRRCVGTCELPAGSGRSRTCNAATDGCRGTGREGPPADWVDPEYLDLPGLGAVLIHPGTDSELLEMVAAGKVRLAKDYREALVAALEAIDGLAEAEDARPPRRRGLFGGRSEAKPVEAP